MLMAAAVLQWQLVLETVRVDAQMDQEPGWLPSLRRRTIFPSPVCAQRIPVVLIGLLADSCLLKQITVSHGDGWHQCKFLDVLNLTLMGCDDSRMNTVSAFCLRIG